MSERFQIFQVHFVSLHKLTSARVYQKIHFYLFIFYGYLFAAQPFQRNHDWFEQKKEKKTKELLAASRLSELKAIESIASKWNSNYVEQ